MPAMAQKLTRAESFFGFHFDFHATKSDSLIGRTFETAFLDSFLTLTKPDFIQVDSKGHPGFSSYPTQIGSSTNSFVKDPLRIWRDVTNKHQIALYVHYSGLWDQQAIKEHPEWARINADGSRDSLKVGYFSDYSSKRLIPQLKEMIDRYDIDGAWIDGDCWATAPDYSPAATAGFIQKHPGINIPKKKSDKYYSEWLDYSRMIFRQYLRNYIDQLNRYKPGFQIASNWAFSSMMPEKVDVPVDFLSGDVSGQNGLYNAAFQARCLALQGKPWDLMAWGFVPVDFWKGIHTPKSLVQLEQEAAEVIAIGGGFQVYFQQNRDASFRHIDLKAMQHLSQFCRERQVFCQNIEIVPQIGVWYSLDGWKKQFDGVYGWSSDMEGINSLLLDGQHSVEILMDHQLKNRLNQYPLIVIPEWHVFNSELKKQLIDYLKEGGNVLVIGAKASREFKNQIEALYEGADTTVQLNIGGKELGGIAGIKTRWQRVIPSKETQIVGHVYSQCDEDYKTNYPVATVNTYGKGKIGVLYMDFSAPYNSTRTTVYNEIINTLIAKLMPNELVKLTGDSKVHVVTARKNGDLLIHLINAAGDHSNKDIYSYNELRPVSPLHATIGYPKKPGSVWLEPEHRPLNFEYMNKEIHVNIPPFAVHSIIRVVE
jgi:hypothetical protein